VLTKDREIIDESDVYIDVHKAIRRLTPAPKARVQRRLSEDPSGKYNDIAHIKSDSDSAIIDSNRASQTVGATSHESPLPSTSPKTATLMMRRSSAGLDGQFLKTTVPVRANFQDIKQHLKHLGPSNPATNPNKTRSTTVKIKPGSGIPSAHPRSASVAEHATDETPMEEEGDETTSLLKPQISGKDGVQALRQTYGSVSPAITVQLAPQSNGIPELILDAEEQADKSTQPPAQSDLIDMDSEEAAADSVQSQQQQQRDSSPSQPKRQLRGSSSGESANSADDKKTDANTLVWQRPYVRSGSITENVIESRGVRKVVLETTSSNDDEEAAVAAGGSSPDQPRLLGRSTFGLFGRDRENGKDKEGVNGKEDGRNPPSPVVEEEDDDDENVLSPGPEDEDEPGSYAEAAAKGTSQESQSGSSSGAGKKKNRRKKRKGGKS
jgi:metal transporter CNNM